MMSGRDDTRSETAVAADRLQEQIVHRSRVWQIWALVGFLALGVWLAVSFDVNGIYIIAGIVAWGVFAIHLSFTQALHELYEINDQIAGRKDEFKTVIQHKVDDPVP